MCTVPFLYICSHYIFQDIYFASVLDHVPHIVVTAVSLVPAVQVAWNTMVAARVSAIPGQVGRLIFGSLVSHMPYFLVIV